jgi:hypothetical protein
MIRDGLNWNSFVGGVCLMFILAVLGIAAILLGEHDALVALISLVTGVGIGAGSVTQRSAGPVARAIGAEKPGFPTPPQAPQ